MVDLKSSYGSLEIYIKLLDNIFKFYPDGVVCKDSNLRYLFVNNAYCNIFSLNHTEDLIDSDCNKILSKKNLKLINDVDKEVSQNRYSLNYILNTDNGQILNITSSPIIKDSVFIGILSCVKDITHEEHIKEKFVNKHFQYISSEKSLQTQRETFVASIGHDLKNPTIAQIRGLELLLKGTFGTLNKEQSEILEMILDSCRYMNGMLSSLLETYRNYGGAIKLDFAEFSLNELVKKCISEMVYVAKDKALEIEINTVDSDFVFADRVQIKRVIMNLLSNAIKYAYKNTELKINITKNSENIGFEFKNKSPYIPEEKQKSIFARYVSYEGVHKELGIGLGLYASKKIIESHHGHIYVKSFHDDTNIFGFIIPIKQKQNFEKDILIKF